jgi:imidazolonepropionase-like amidohydrolase
VLTLKAAGLVDIDAGEIVRPGILRIDGDRIVGVGGGGGGADGEVDGEVDGLPEGEVIDLGELILLPGLMDMEVNLLMGGRGETVHLSPIQDDPPLRMLRAVGNARRTLRAGFTTVRNLGLFVKTGGYLLDVALMKAIDAGWIDGAEAVRAAVEAGIDRIEHGFLIDDETIALMVKRGTFLVPTTFLADGMDVSAAAPELQAKAAVMFPRARESARVAAAAGVRIAVGTDAPAIPHGKNACELVALVSRGMSPLAVLRAATVTGAELIDVTDRGRLAPGLLADVIAVPGDPLQDITVTQDVRFVMRGGKVFVPCVD